MPKRYFNIFKDDKIQTQKTLKKLILIFSILFYTLGFTQTLGSNLDKDKLTIGEIATLKIKVFDLDGKDVESAPLKKLLPHHFITVKDSIVKTKTEYERTVQFFIGTEGNFTLDPLLFRINGKVDKTIPYQISVTNTAHPTDEINDIMGNKQVKLGWKEYWDMYKWYFFGVLILLGLVYIMYQIIRFTKKQKISPKATTNKALKELDLLKKKKYIQQNNYRSFYVELIEIMRNFLTEQYMIPANVLLTDDLLRYIKKYHIISQENEELLEDTFTRGDLVKFAKTFPTPEVMEKDLTDLRAFVKQSLKELELEKHVRKNA